jgi:hypothetical protein
MESLVGDLTDRNQSVALTNSGIREWLVGHVQLETPACFSSFVCDSLDDLSVSSARDRVVAGTLLPRWPATVVQGGVGS